jgi:hypothetical protein
VLPPGDTIQVPVQLQITEPMELHSEETGLLTQTAGCMACALFNDYESNAEVI